MANDSKLISLSQAEKLLSGSKNWTASTISDLTEIITDALNQLNEIKADKSEVPKIIELDGDGYRAVSEEEKLEEILYFVRDEVNYAKLPAITVLDLDTGEAYQFEFADDWDTIKDGIKNGTFGERVKLTFGEGQLVKNGEIESGSLANSISLVEAVFDNSVKKIGSGGFYGCSNLEKITLAEGLETVGASCFGGTAIKEIIIPSTVISMESGVFLNSPLEYAEFKGTKTFASVFGGASNFKKVKFAPGTTEIVASCCSSCPALEEVDFPEGLLTIGQTAFFNSNLTKVVLPDTVTKIEQLAFDSSPSLSNIFEFTLPRDLETIEKQGLPTTIQSLIVRSSTCKNWFNGMNYSTYPSLTSVSIEETVEEIGEGAFNRCPNLANVTIKEGVTTISDYAFQSTAITEITLPATLTSIGNQVFDNCSSLTKIYINLPKNAIDVSNVGVDESIIEWIGGES